MSDAAPGPVTMERPAPVDRRVPWLHLHWTREVSTGARIHDSPVVPRQVAPALAVCRRARQDASMPEDRSVPLPRTCCVGRTASRRDVSSLGRGVPRDSAVAPVAERGESSCPGSTWCQRYRPSASGTIGRTAVGWSGCDRRSDRGAVATAYDPRTPAVSATGHGPSAGKPAERVRDRAPLASRRSWQGSRARRAAVVVPRPDRPVDATRSQRRRQSDRSAI